MFERRAAVGRFLLVAALVATAGFVAGVGSAASSPPAVAAGAPSGAVAPVQGDGRVRLVHLCPRPETGCEQALALRRGSAGNLRIDVPVGVEHVGAAQLWRPSGLPATVVLRDGQAVGAMVGSRPTSTLVAEVNALSAAVAAGAIQERAALLRADVDARPLPGVALTIGLRYREGRFAVQSVRRIAGTPLAPQRDTLESYVIQVVDDAGRVLDARPWKLNRFVSPPPPRPGQAPGGLVERLDFETAIVLPWYAEAASVRVLQPYGVETLAVGIAATPRLPADVGSGPTTPVRVTGPDANRLTILFVGDRYRKNQRDTFATDVDVHLDRMLSTRPINKPKIRNNLNVYRSDRTNGMRCKYGCGGNDRLICCNDQRVLNAAASADVPVDQIVVLVNKPTFGGSGGLYAVAYNRHEGAQDLGPEVTVHESGHSIWGLMDEYEYFIPGVPNGPNCQVAPCTWKGKGLGCWDGCSYTGLSRPTENHCLMRDLAPSHGIFEFCRVGQKQIKQVNREY